MDPRSAMELILTIRPYSLRAHQRHRGAHRVQHAAGVTRQRQVEGVVGDMGHPLVAQHSGQVDHDVESVVVGGDGGDGPLDGRAVGDVELARRRRATTGGQLARQARGSVAVEVADDDVHAPQDQRCRAGRAQSARRPGDQCDASRLGAGLCRLGAPGRRGVSQAVHTASLPSG